jgi:hypothetical protein
MKQRSALSSSATTSRFVFIRNNEPPYLHPQQRPALTSTAEQRNSNINININSRTQKYNSNNSSKSNAAETPTAS